MMSDSELKSSNEAFSTFDHDERTDPYCGMSAEERELEERRLLWKLDIQLIPWIAHLTEDIPMTTNEFNATLTIFFVGYAAFEVLANFLLKRFRPSIFIPSTMVLWGACMLSMGFVTSWSGLMATRWWLGVTEAGLFPGVNYYLSCWYKRSEFGVRAAIFFSAAAIAGSFGGLLAAAIQTMDGVANYAGWRWIFIIEGAITVVIGIVSYWMVHDFPDEAKFLNEDDRARVLLRLKEDKQSSAEHEDFRMEFLWAALKDWKMYVGMLIYMGPLMPLYSFSLFLPTIIQNMSFTGPEDIIKNQLLSVPPYILAALLTVAVGFWSDRIQRRGIFNICCAPVSILGFVMLICTTDPMVQYAGTFLGAMGIYPAISLTIAWIANNVEGVYKRGIVLGGHAVIIAYLFICIFGGSILMTVLLSRENRRRSKGLRDEWAEGKSAQEIETLGDNRPDFFYTL
uniref:Major facilitator superfamily (MFS) profile domain-containing protein n=1 Tax=Bionectria ochroleuca TaxID=29856 RepID=A0A8H7NN92_BIOOC